MIDFDNFDWSSVFSVLKNTKSMGSKNQWRGFRTELIELSISKYSNGQLIYVGDDKRYDFDGGDGLKYECKIRHGMFQTKSKFTKPFILKNFFGDKSKLVKEFDNLILLDDLNNSVGTISYEDVLPYMVYKDSYITLKLPLDCITTVISNIPVTKNVIDLKSIVTEQIMKYL